jgi:hypothetical protein
MLRLLGCRGLLKPAKAYTHHVLSSSFSQVSAKESKVEKHEPKNKKRYARSQLSARAKAV